MYIVQVFLQYHGLKIQNTTLWPLFFQAASERNVFEEFQQIGTSSKPSATVAAPAAEAKTTSDSLEDLDKAIEDIDIGDVNASDIDDDELLGEEGTDLLSD